MHCTLLIKNSICHLQDLPYFKSQYIITSTEKIKRLLQAVCARLFSDQKQLCYFCPRCTGENHFVIGCYKSPQMTQSAHSHVNI